MLISHHGIQVLLVLHVYMCVCVCVYIYITYVYIYIYYCLYIIHVYTTGSDICDHLFFRMINIEKSNLIRNVQMIYSKSYHWTKQPCENFLIRIHRLGFFAPIYRVPPHSYNPRAGLS